MAENLRLQVFLSRFGIASRRGASRTIESGRVKVNGRIILEPGKRIDPEKDTVTVDGKSTYKQKKVYFVLNKPRGVVSTVEDRHAKCKAVDFIKHKGVYIYPVGRLDRDTTGLLLLTNDGRIAYRLTHPKFGIKKVYRIWVKGRVSQKTVKRLESGIFLERRHFPAKLFCYAKLIESLVLLRRNILIGIIAPKFFFAKASKKPLRSLGEAGQKQEFLLLLRRRIKSLAGEKT